MTFRRLDEKNLSCACRALCESDKDLARIFQTFGTPPLWRREQGFQTLVHIILEQQVSLASALSAFNKLKEKVGEITPEAVLALSDGEMKEAYFSRQKTVYVKNLAEAVLEKRIDLENLENLADAEAKSELVKLKGIGVWTADIYLLMALLRPDVMPKGDLALHAAWRRLKNLENRPSADEFVLIAEKWKPLRSVAARLLWHFYLNREVNYEKSSL